MSTETDKLEKDLDDSLLDLWDGIERLSMHLADIATYNNFTEEEPDHGKHTLRAQDVAQ